MDPTRKGLALLIVVVACLGIVRVWDRGERAAAATLALARFHGDPGAVGVPRAARAQGLRFAAGVPVDEQIALLAAIQRAHPAAQRLVGVVDGLVEVRLHTGGAPGWTRTNGREVVVSLDVAALRAHALGAYEIAVLHELGHVVDHALVDAQLLARLDRGIPRSQPCEDPASEFGPCAAPEERFADTFSKWALAWPDGIIGLGYHVEAPASFEAWAAPLLLLAPAS